MITMQRVPSIFVTFACAVPLAALAVLTAACGSKSGLVTDEGTPVVDSGRPDTSPPPDGGFDTFPCSWSYGQPLELGAAPSGSTLGGAVHGRADVVWTRTGPPFATDSGFSRLLSLTDPPREIGIVPVTGNVSVHGLNDGWTVLASDCSLSFFDDDGSPLRLFVGPVNSPPCSLDSLDPAYIDVSSVGMPPRSTSATRMSTRGAVIHDVASPRPLGWDPHAAVSADGSLVARFALESSATVTGTLTQATGEVLWSGPVGRADGPFSVSLDRLRDAVVVLLPTADDATLVRVPFDRSGLTVEVLSELGAPVADANESLATNETEALVALDDGRVAVQPLSGSELRFLPAPPEGDVLDLRVLLAPGQSRGGLLYRYRDARGANLFAFRTLTCNR